MKQQAALIGILSCAALLAGEGEAFTASPSLRQTTISTTSSLNLVPDQGKQLVAAYNARCSSSETSSQSQESAAAAAVAPIQVENDDVDVDGHEHVDESSHWRAIAASKSFLTRVFHKPSGNHPDSFHQQNKQERKHEDVVYYPMVGFRFFEGIDNVFPTTSHVSCAIPTKRQKEEEVYGWFSSQSCKLDLLSEDVCYNPNVSSSSDDASSLP